MGFRSFSKKHQMKFSDDEERAMWEKKFGVFYFFNAVVFAASPFHMILSVWIGFCRHRKWYGIYMRNRIPCFGD